MRRISVIAAGVVAACLAVGTALAQSPPLKLGVFFEFTGAASYPAESGRFGVDLAIDEINKAGGIAGRKIQPVYADNQTDPTVAVGEIKRLVLQEKVDAVIGPLVSQDALAALPITTEAKIPSLGSTGSELITPQVGPYYFSVLINAESQAKAMVDEAITLLKAKSGAVLSDSGAQAKTFVEAIKKEMAARGMKLTGAQEYQYRATDMSPQLLALKRGAPDTLFLFSSTGEDVGNAIKSMGELGWKVKVTGNYTVATFAPSAIGIAGKEAFADVTGISYTAFTYCKSDDLPKPFVAFLARGKAFNAEKQAKLAMPYAATLYDNVYLLKAAIEGSGGKTDGPTVAAWIEQNGKSFSNVLTGLSPSTTTHFLVGPDALTAVYPDRSVPGGMQQRYGCN
jgi:branched-chain amino acid transport system substrate-binding protein